MGRFAGSFRRYMCRGLPALWSKFAPQTFPAFIYCHLLWQCGCHFMAGSAISNPPITGYSTQTVAAFWAMALISQLIGHSSYNWSLKWFSTSLVAVSLLGEPIGSTLLAYIIFDEGLTWMKFIGGLFILSAIYIAASDEK